MAEYGTMNKDGISILLFFLKKAANCETFGTSKHQNVAMVASLCSFTSRIVSALEDFVGQRMKIKIGKVFANTVIKHFMFIDFFLSQVQFNRLCLWD